MWVPRTPVVPNGTATGLDIGLSNFSLSLITLSFYTMCKSTTPVFLLAFCFVWGIERCARWPAHPAPTPFYLCQPCLQPYSVDPIACSLTCDSEPRLSLCLSREAGTCGSSAQAPAEGGAQAGSVC